MADFTLYLDESETRTDSAHAFFSIAGVIISHPSEAGIITDLNSLKKKLWNNDPAALSYILHEKEVSEAQHNGKATHSYNTLFRQVAKRDQLYLGLSMILKKHNITTLGTCVDLSLLKDSYPGETNPKLTIALQLLLENYCHFLITHNATGDICYESLQEPGNQGLRQRFYELEALGTLYYTPRAFQTHIGDISFVDKQENLVGLQLADFIPNTFARYCSKAAAKHDTYKKTVLKMAYDGKVGNSRKYGMKIIP